MKILRAFTRILAFVVALSTYVLAQQPDTGRYDALSATVWQQMSGEFRALCYQAYSLARLRLDADLRDSSSTQSRAIIVDVDETVLDNSPHQAKLLITGSRYPAWWKEWVDRASAEAIPGAADFLQYASSHGVSIYYITNRSPEEAKPTIDNLRRRGFPDADSHHVMVRAGESSKDKRRLAVASNHRIVLLIGDNLNDFASMFDRASVSQRIDAVTARAAEFGDRWIILPNPLYGDWESAVLKYERSLPPDSIHARRLQSLRSFE